MKNLGILSLGLLLSFSAQAHEGHGHSGPEAVNGGIVQEGKQLNVELVTQGSDVMVYTSGKDGKSINPSDVSLVGTAEPRGKQKSKLDFKPMSNHLHAKVDAKGAKRFELKLEAKLKSGQGKAADRFTFQVEPEG